MAKKHQPLNDLATIRARVERTRNEGRYQQALELAKALYKAEPTTAHQDLLKDTYLKRAEQLHANGYSRDAATVLEAASRLDEQNVVWLAKLAARVGQCGEVGKAMELLARVKQLGGAADDSATMGMLADGAVSNEKASRDLLPPEMRADLDRVVKAFQHAEAGQDDAARDAMQAISLRSPFLEWKILLRGLMAYYQGDDGRARENWQRLDPSRLPARLSAPYRAAIDEPFRTAQKPQTQEALRQQIEWLSGDAVQTHLRALRQALTNRETLAPAFRAAEALLPLIKPKSPQLVARLGRFFYNSILRYGPDELPRYRRVFGAPPDDPNFHRLEAIAMGEGSNFAGAHQKWQAFEKEIVANAVKWPGEQGAFARALIWEEMGDNAALVPTKEQMKKLPRFLRDIGPVPKPLKPSAEECYAKSLQLAPKLLSAHEGLVQHHMRSMQVKPAIDAAEHLLQAFPDHIDTLKNLSMLYMQQENFSAARSALERATRHNPLDRELRDRLGHAHLVEARPLALADDFDEARKHYQAALEYVDAERQPFVSLRWAACEVRAGDSARADELIGQARAKLPGELLVSYYLLIEANRMKHANTLKTKLTKEFNTGIEGTPTAALAVGLTEVAAEYAAGPTEYYGRATHAKKIALYAGRVPPREFTEKQLEKLVANLVTMEAQARLITTLFHFAGRAFPDNPRFPYLHAVRLMGDDPEETPQHWQVSHLLTEAEQLAAKRPADEPGMRAMLDDIKRRKQILQTLNPLMDRLQEMFGGAFGFDEG